LRLRRRLPQPGYPALGARPAQPGAGTPATRCRPAGPQQGCQERRTSRSTSCAWSSAGRDGCTSPGLDPPTPVTIRQGEGETESGKSGKARMRE
jgi:hypothetical protein